MNVGLSSQLVQPNSQVSGQRGTIIKMVDGTQRTAYPPPHNDCYSVIEADVYAGICTHTQCCHSHYHHYACYYWDTTVEGKVCSLSDQDETKLGKGSS